MKFCICSQEAMSYCAERSIKWSRNIQILVCT